MSVDPNLVAAGAVVVALAAAAAYTYFTGSDTAVDVDGDGDADVSFEGREGGGAPDVTVSVSLEDVRGVGPATSAALEAAGFETASDLADATIAQLTEVEGIGEDRALNLSVNASKALDAAAE